MNKNAAIIEGDITKKFNPVSKVKVSNSDTGESTWIPEDSKETHSLSVIKNGIYYAASEGYTAYDTVTVNVSSETEVNYEGILADMPDLADLGLYDLDDLEGLDGLDLDLDEMLDLENLILDGDLEEGEIPTSGSTIKGIDPDTGETLEVGLDEDGNLMEQALPDHIHIVVWPRKRHYLEGEIIDFSGIHVYLMKQGTTRFTCEQYPTGEIPFGELIFPVTVASEGEGEEYYKTSYDEDFAERHPELAKAINFPIQSCNSYSWESQYWGYSVTSDGYMFATNVYENGLSMCACSLEPFTVTMEDTKHSFPPTTTTYSDTATFDGKTFYVSGIETVSFQPNFEYSGPPETGGGMNYVAYLILFGDTKIEGGNTIPVQWMRSDGEILEDTFEITIGEGEDPEPEPDPYAGQCDFTWEGKKYCFNKSLARCEIMYSNGTVWQTWLGGQSPPYTVDQALKLKLIVQVGWSGGGSTSGGF